MIFCRAATRSKAKRPFLDLATFSGGLTESGVKPLVSRRSFKTVFGRNNHPELFTGEHNFLSRPASPRLYETCESAGP